MRVVAAGGRGDEEDQVSRAVLGAEVHAGGAAAEGERRGGDVRAAGVRDADAAGQAGRHLLLALADVGDEAVDVGDAAVGGQRLDEGAGGGVPVGRLEIEQHVPLGDQVGHVDSFVGADAGQRCGWLRSGGGRRGIQPTGGSVSVTSIPATSPGAGIWLPGRPTAAVPQATPAARAAASRAAVVQETRQQRVAGPDGGHRTTGGGGGEHGGRRR